jgi:hypothetical protein
MATVTRVELSGENVDGQKARIEVTWRMSFSQREVLSRTVFLYEVFLQNVDGAGDLDVRRRRIATGSNLAAENPINEEISALVNRTFLDEDFQVFGFGDTTDEWRAEVHLKPFVPTGTSAQSAGQLRKEFGFS